MNHKGLSISVQGKGEDGILGDPKNIKKIEPCKYLHLSPARPNGIAAANAKNAQRIQEWMEKFSLQSPSGFLKIFSDINRIPEGNCSTSGGSEYLIPFDTKKTREL